MTTAENTEAYDISGADEDYWKRAKERLDKHRRIIAKQWPLDDERTWNCLQFLMWLENYVLVCTPGTTDQIAKLEQEIEIDEDPIREDFE